MVLDQYYAFYLRSLFLVTAEVLAQWQSVSDYDSGDESSLSVWSS